MGRRPRIRSGGEPEPDCTAHCRPKRPTSGFVSRTSPTNRGRGRIGRPRLNHKTLFVFGQRYIAQYTVGRRSVVPVEGLSESGTNSRFHRGRPNTRTILPTSPSRPGPYEQLTCTSNRLCPCLQAPARHPFPLISTGFTPCFAAHGGSARDREPK